ncbi:MAG: hypothetical protein EPN82_08065 [Bacteroidetes bacterium]|nr:MAG: hypothetical protein EPN82_08065 [Bacteroidota bacterium]
MRITQNSIFTNFLTSLQDIQERKFGEEMKLSTGKDILSISDDPKRVREIKEFSNKISKDEIILSNLSNTYNELAAVNENIDSMVTVVGNIKQLLIDSTQIGASKSLATIGTNVKGLLEDLVKLANSTYKDKYLYSGTQTTPGSIVPTPPETNNNPFEIVTDAPTPSNPSGLRVSFKGNTNDRTVHKDATTTEVINTKADALFGTNGEQLFQAIIDVYNLMSYQNGLPRPDNQGYTKAEQDQLNNAHKSLMTLYDKLTTANSVNGSKLNRIDILKEQLTEEITRLKDFRSSEEDADIARTSLELKKDETSLNYTLQVGSNLMSRTLFDFLT